MRIAKINKMHAFIVASYEVTESSKFGPPLKNQTIARGAIPMSMIAKAAPVSKGNIGDPYAYTDLNYRVIYKSQRSITLIASMSYF